MLWSLIAGLFSGASNSILLALISSALKVNDAAGRTLLFGFIGLCVVLPVSRYVSEVLLSKLGQTALYNLRMELSRQILAAPLRHLEQLSAPRLLAVLTDDVPAVTAAIMSVPLLCVSIAVVIGCIIYMGWLSPVLLAIVLGFIVVGTGGYQFSVFRAQCIFKKARQDADSLMGHFRAMTQGAKELKIHADRRKVFLDDVLGVTAASLSRHNMSGMKVYTVAASWGQTLVFVVIGLVVFALPRTLHAEGLTLTGYTLALLYLMSPLQAIMGTLPTIARAHVALDRIYELGFSLASKEPEDVLHVQSPATNWRRLHLASVVHEYRGEDEASTFTLGPITTTLQSGELVFITGGNGSGKTTFAKLLCGLYFPEQGTIELDGQNISTPAEREYYRQHFAVVFSDCFLFEQLLGMAGPDLDERALEYLKELNLADKVKIQDGRLSTVDLSQGQRKRLALLSAFLEDRPIYLFDEWAADQDPYFKAIFYLRLLPQLRERNKTIIVITHHDRYYDCADRLIKLETGKIVSDTRKVPSSSEAVALSFSSHQR